MLPLNFMTFPEKTDAEVVVAISPWFTVLEGNPTVTNIRKYVNEELKRNSGVWKATPGRFRVEYELWEFCHFMKGHSVITHDNGQSWEVKAGDSFIFEPGFRGEWLVVEEVEKHYVTQR